LSRVSSTSCGRPDRGSAGTPELFVYGTLVLDVVVATLMDRVPSSEVTSAPGWRAARLPGLPYPGLVADDAADAPGRVYTDLSDDEWAILDAFENPTYDVAVVELRSGRCGLAYVWPDESLPATWTVESLAGEGLQSYLERCASWRTRHDGHQRRPNRGPLTSAHGRRGLTTAHDRDRDAQPLTSTDVPRGRRQRI